MTTILVAIIVAIIAFFIGKYIQGKNNLAWHIKRVEQEQAELENQKQQHQKTLNQIQNETQIKQNALAAIQRKIDGYGSQYLIPSTQIIDGLAEQYDYNNSGQRLKECRQQMRKMLKTGQAVAGNNQHSRILLDFFNTKVEDLIARVKQENYGTLKQELADIYALTQYYATEAMFTAQISHTYYEIRQNELKWASIC